jgi:hypothetical protein
VFAAEEMLLGRLPDPVGATERVQETLQVRAGEREKNGRPAPTDKIARSLNIEDYNIRSAAALNLTFCATVFARSGLLLVLGGGGVRAQRRPQAARGARAVGRKGQPLMTTQPTSTV